jgi:hypothetical protein
MSLSCVFKPSTIDSSDDMSIVEGLKTQDKDI